jgi:uncharacterized protein (DUF2236 family)
MTISELRAVTARHGAHFDDGLMGIALLAGPANVIMQLARPGVGYGVLESRVESGRVDLHPIKRARTTFTYLAVATKGSDEQKAAFRRDAAGLERQEAAPVRSGDGRTAHGQSPDATVHPAVPVQLVAERPRLVDPHRTAAVVVSEVRSSR